MGILGDQIAHRQHTVADGVGIGRRRKEAFDHKLFVIEIGKEEVLHAGHPEQREQQQGESGEDRQTFIGDQASDGPSDEPVGSGSS